MKEKYRAAFIIPRGAKKILDEDGWNFETSNRVPAEVGKFLIDALKLKFSESYLGIDSYVGDKMKMSVGYDEQAQVENIYFQLRGDAIDTLSGIFLKSPFTKKSELFIPREE